MVKKRKKKRGKYPTIKEFSEKVLKPIVSELKEKQVWQAVDAKDGVHTIFEEQPTKNLEPAPTRLDVLMGEFESELNRVINKLKATF